MPRRGPLALVFAAALVLTGMSVGAVAWAEMTAVTPSTSHTLATGTLEPPTAPATAAGTCVLAIGDQIVLSWTMTPSPKADGYEILRAVGSGEYSTRALVTDRTTQSFTDGGLSFSTQYHYVVKAKKASWRSDGTTPVSRTTRSITCT